MHSIQPVGGPWEPDRRFTWPNSLPGANRPCPISAAYLLLLLVAICKQWTIAAQRPLQFIPAGIEAEIPARLAFRPEGLVEALTDPDGSTAVISGDLNLDPNNWREAFAATGGSAPIGPKGVNRPHVNFTISGELVCPAGSDCSALNDNISAGPGSLNFQRMVYALTVEQGGLLQLQNIVLYGSAARSDYVYAPEQPYRLALVDSDMWPTIGMAPGAKLRLVNVTISYWNDAPGLSCEERSTQALYSLQQLRGKDVVVQYNSTAGRVPGRLVYTLNVLNGSNNETLGAASFYMQNVTFNCLHVAGQAAGLPAPQLAAAIAVPVGLALLAAVVCRVLCHKRCRTSSLVSSWRDKDVEVAAGDPAVTCSSDALYGGHHCDSSGQPSAVVADHKLVSLQQQQQQQQPVDNGNLQITTSEAAAVAVQARFGSHSRWSESSGLAHALTASSSFDSDKLVAASCPSSSCEQQHQSQEQQINLLAQDSLASSNYRSVSDDEQAVDGQPGDWPNRCVDDSLPAVTVAACPVTYGAASAGCTTGAADDSGVLTCSSAGESAGNSTVASGDSGGGPPGGSCDTSSKESGMLSAGSAAFGSGGAGGVPALLKARSDMAVLRDLKIGPLLGKGSYGRVHKGRWKSATVAVKIIEHRSGSPGTASSSAGKQIMVDRETAVAESIAHPNVVQTYHISTMSARQRAAITSSLQGIDVLSSRDSKSGNRQSDSAAAFAAADDDDSDGNNSGSDDDRRDHLETWIIMEFCEKGSMDKAMKLGKFTSAGGEPNMIGIYKALLDTASGLDYLHSVGVVHGDLKAANVLLKGSTRDVRGFACKITDFGLSRVLDLDATHVSTRTYGTITYMPREMLLTGHISRATDIYSFGLLMWELYTSTCVFEDGMSIGQMFYMIAYDNWRPHVPEDCAPGYAALMRACWDVDPDLRPTAQQVLRSLQKLYFVEKGSTSAGRGSPVVSSPTHEGGTRSAYQDWAKPLAGATGSSSPTGSDAPLAASISSSQAAGLRQKVLASSSCISSEPAPAQGSGAVQQAWHEQRTQLPQQPLQQPHDISSVVAETGPPCQQAQEVTAEPTTAVLSGPADASAGMETGARAGIVHSDAALSQQAGSDTGGQSGGSSGTYRPWAEAVSQEEQQQHAQQQSRPSTNGESARKRQTPRAFGSVFMADQHAQQLHNKAVAALDGSATSGQEVAQPVPQHLAQQMQHNTLLSGRDRQQGALLPEQQQSQSCAVQDQQQQQWEHSAWPSKERARVVQGSLVGCAPVPPFNGGVVGNHQQQQQQKTSQPLQQPRSVSSFWAAISGSMHHHHPASQVSASQVSASQAAAHQGTEGTETPSQQHRTEASTEDDGSASSPYNRRAESSSHAQQQQSNLAGDPSGSGCTKRQRAFGSLFYGDAHQPEHTHGSGLAAASRASNAAGIPQSSVVKVALSLERQQSTATPETVVEHDRHLQTEAAAEEGQGIGADTQTSDSQCSKDRSQQEVQQQQHAIMPGQPQQEQQDVTLSEQQHSLHGTVGVQEERLPRCSSMQRARQQHIIQQRQQQEQHDAMLLRQLSTYYRIGSSSDGQLAVDNEQLPSESLFQADEMPSTSTCASQYLSSGANTMFRETDGQSIPSSRHSSTGFRSVSSNTSREQQEALQQQSLLDQQQQEQWANPGPPNQPAAAAAQSFLAALELVTGPPAAVAAPAAYPGINPYQLPYHYQQRPLMAQHILNANAPNMQPFWAQGNAVSGVGSSSLFGPDTPGARGSRSHNPLHSASNQDSGSQVEPDSHGRSA